MTITEAIGEPFTVTGCWTVSETDLVWRKIDCFATEFLYEQCPAVVEWWGYINP
jgi:hypothetical protein